MFIIRCSILCLALMQTTVAAPERRATLDDAISEAREDVPGRVLSAETVRENGQEVHRLRILSEDGRVRRYNMDAQTGRRMKGRR
jgi:uncharacterized membrane protein YkoI